MVAAPRNERIGPRHRCCLRVHGRGGMLTGCYSLSANNVGWGDVHGIMDGSLLQRQFPINQIVTDCKTLPLPEIVAGIVVCGHSDSDSRQADRTKRFNHAAHQN